MPVESPHERSASMASTEPTNQGQPAAPPQEPNENAEATSNDNNNVPVEEDIPPKPVHIRNESRDVSVCSRNTRDSLRRNVSMRSNTFTEWERLFLEQLTFEGSDRDVEMALKTVEDEELFFEHSSPKHQTQNPEQEIGLYINQSTSSGPDDALRDGGASSVATSERRGLDKAATTSLTSSGASHRRRSSNKPPIPATILGSQRRREVLQRRRSDSSLNMATLWRAHATGLAVTSLGSQKSLLRRESSVSSIGSNMSGLSVLFGNRPNPGASQDDVFRADKKEGGNNKIKMQTTPSKGRKPPRQFSQGRILPPMVRRSPHRRSKSAVLFSPPRNLPKISETGVGKPSHVRAKSFGKRRSVTFHHIDEELEFDKDRAVSDSHIDMELQVQAQTGSRRDSTSSIPSLHQGTPLRQDSITSIPSLHHGHPLQDYMSVSGQSTTSIPSLHHGKPIRDSISSPMGQSTSSVPSLHHANPLRDSTASLASAATFASLNPANPLRQDSLASFPSLHPGKVIRNESMSSIPSLHHGRQIRTNSMTSNSIAQNAMSQDQIVRQFGVTKEMAAAWLELSTSKNTMENSEIQSSVVPNPALPHYLPSGGDKRSSIMSTVTLPPSLLEVPTDPTMSSVEDAEKNPDTSAIEEDDGVSLLTPMSNREAFTGFLGSAQKPVFFRQASRNAYEGEGVEVTEFDDKPLDATLSVTDSYYYQHPRDNSVFRTVAPLFSNYGSIRTAGSFDDISIFSSYGQQQRTSEVFREIRRSLSDESLSHFVGSQNKEFLLQIPNPTDGTTSDTFVDEMSDDGGWDFEFISPASGRFDAWNILQDEYANGYGGAGTLGFKILGTSVSDEASQPHVLSPPLMESLQAFLPITKSGENFYMKYSMIRDGASLQTLLKRARGVQYSILAVETIDGEVFGSFTGQAWRKSWNYFGTGESFLWKMRHSRLEQTNGILDQAQKESEIDVYPYTGGNDFIQLCTHDRIAVGGGIPKGDDAVTEKKTQDEPLSSNSLVDHAHDWGLGLALRSDLLEGCSSPCVTFGSPSLCKTKPNGDRFEVINVELWTTTPCASEEDAEKLELGKLFLGSPNNSRSNGSFASPYKY